MNFFVEAYNFFEKMMNERHLPAFLSGIAAGIGLVWVVGRLTKDRIGRGLIAHLRAQLSQMTVDREVLLGDNERLRSKCEGLDDQKSLLQDLAKNRDGQIEILKEQLIETSAVCERQSTELFDLRARIRLERKTRLGVKKLADGYSKQLNDIANSDGRVWLRSTNGHSVPFLPLTRRYAAIISLANLKGGVGKTTMTANLGVSLALEGLKVLLIDLDQQSSLTNLCLSLDEQDDVRHSQRHINDLFDGGGDLATFNRCVTRLREPTGKGQLYVAAVNEEFSDVENRLMTRWDSGVISEDVRFRLRNALHSQQLRQSYDVVLIDCPPRLTTGSVNALAASDYVIIPVLLEDTSAEGVPRILAWLKKFQTTSCADLNILGVVGNKAYPRKKIIGREQLIWDALKDKCKHAWGSPVHFFDEIIREHSSLTEHFAAQDPKHRVRYSNLVNQIRREIPHAHLQPATVPPLAGAPTGGGGH